MIFLSEFALSDWAAFVSFKVYEGNLGLVAKDNEIIKYTIKDGIIMAKSTNKTKTETKSTIEQLLNREVANLNVLYVKLHNYHWYVKGSNFFTLHNKFEELYNTVSLQMDEVAERLLTIKGSPAATMKEYLDLASIQEASGGEDPKTMVQNLIEDFATLSEEYVEGIEAAEEAGDGPTADMLTGFQADLEKHIWMLRSYLA
ncbi:starvation-inducible DNA-binding protein [Paenibacillus sp. 453mf]|nr:starvation-inducible DNA-binding protein [Paenibacillus sp. 453mf]